MREFRLLGPLEARVDDRPVPLPAGKPSALLARLLLDANRIVPVETLLESIWGDPPPPSARKVLQVYISQLRKAIDADAIETRAPGYRIVLERDDYDLGRFERLVEAGRAAEAPRRVELLRQALSLWRGTPLAEFRQEPFAPPAGRRLAELRLSALEQRLEAELQLGRHEALVGELETLVEQEPLREGLRRQLMLALYRSGRQADALERYREGRRLLVEELGIEPGPGLQELERAILRHDPALDEPAARRDRGRGSVVCAGAQLHPLLAPLCRDGRELLLVELVAEPRELSQRAGTLDAARVALAAGGVAARTACFTSTAPGDDLARLAAEQEAELLVLGLPFAGEARERLLDAAPCDVAVALPPGLPFEPTAPVLVPFGGGRDEWAALELGAWLARAHGLPLRLLGTSAKDGGRDASRMLASASLALQRFAAISAEPAIVVPGPEGILAEQGSVIVASLPPGELDRTRRTLAERSAVPVLYVRPGLRPGGLTPDRTLTHFSWSLRDAG
jgi:DNA-binding SARP family transcriptional activator